MLTINRSSAVRHVLLDITKKEGNEKDE